MRLGIRRAYRASALLLVAAAAACGTREDVLATAAPLVTTETATLVASPGSITGDPAGAGFGASVAITPDGSRIVVGSEWERDASAEPVGAVRVFARAGAAWAEETVIHNTPGENSDRYGSSVAITPDASRLFVGVGQDTTAVGQASGSVRVLTRSGSTWTQEAMLQNPDLTSFDLLGFRVAASSDGARVAALLLGDPGARGVRVFSRTGTTWSQEASLAVRGASLAMSADGLRVAVGSPADATRAFDAGAVRVYARAGTTWALEATVTAADAATADHFGQAVALASDGSRLLVGAPDDDVGTVTDAGSVRAFTRTGSTWSPEATLSVRDAAMGDGLGSVLAITPDASRALASALLDDVGATTDVGSVRVFFRSGNAWAEEGVLSPSGGATRDAVGTSLATTTAGDVAVVGVEADDLMDTFSGEGSVRVFSIGLATVGSACGVDAVCASGFCVDGVCCASACGGDRQDDCQACSAARTGGVDGACAALTAALAPTVVCRPAADLCDAPESCTATSATCPADGVSPTGTECRARTDACDRPETCTGTSAACPADAGLEAAGVPCRVAAPDTCDATETCTGTSPVCPADGILPSGAECRASAGACDNAEVCDGISAACPGDAFQPAGTVCRARGGVCDVIDTCTGLDAACPLDVVRPAGTVCALRDPALPCDADDLCDGASPTCPATYAVAGTECAPPNGDLCDAPDVCNGTSAECVPAYLSGVVCRPATGSCDPADVCSGTSASCPLDSRTAAGRSCRASTAAGCDPEEFCDGVAAACPADVNTCEPDAGPTPVDAAESDGGATHVDASSAPPAPTTGCACGAARARASDLAPWIGLLLVVGVRGRRRRSA